jgi:tungstate transport system ATP-binding protein
MTVPAGPSGPEILYRLRDLRVDAGARRILEIDRLEIGRGRVTVLVGPNGAGKSTLLRVLALLLPPTSGTVELDGHAIEPGARDLTPLRRRATYVAQTPLVLHRSTRANVAYGLRARGSPAGARVEAALSKVGLESFADRPAWRLSGGEVQRLALARALAIDPAVYLLDEPTANIDRRSVPLVENLVDELRDAGRTVILSTHDPEQAHRLADEAVALDAGRIAPAPLVNVLHGVAVRIGERNLFRTEAGMQIELPGDERPRRIHIHADELIVSRQPLRSSARNCFSGRVVRVGRDRRGVILTVDCGEPLLARITAHSYEEMGLEIGAEVCVTFKSFAVHGDR